MYDKREILRVLIEQHVFAPSAKAFAKLIGHNAMSIYRFAIGEQDLKDRTIDQIWDKVKRVTQLEDEALYITYIIFHMSNVICSELHKHEHESTSIINNVFINMCETNIEALPDDFLGGYMDILMEIRRNDVSAFFSIMAAVILKSYNTYNPYEKGAFYGELQGLFFDINCGLKCHYGEHSEGAITNVINLFENKEYLQHCTSFNLFGATQMIHMILMSYCVPKDFQAFMLGSSTSYWQWGECSWWIVPGTKCEPGATVWCMHAIVYDSNHQGGFYNLYKTTVLNTNGAFKIKNVRRMVFQEYKDITVCLFATLPSKYLSDQQKITRYIVSVDEDNIQFSNWDSNDSITTDRCLAMPESLCRIDVAQADNHEEIVWQQAIEQFQKKDFKDQYRRIIAESIGVELIDLTLGYEITDVMVGWKYVYITICNRKSGTEQTYSICREYTDALKSITLQDEVFLCRHHGDENIYVEWAAPELSIPLKDFIPIGIAPSTPKG